MINALNEPFYYFIKPDSSYPPPYSKCPLLDNALAISIIITVMSTPQNVEDSLDNLSNLQMNRHRQLLAQVKQQFATQLEKLQSAETREIVTMW